MRWMSLFRTVVIGITLSLLSVSMVSASVVGAHSQMIPPDARAYGMGTAFTAIAEGPAAGFWNPAALGMNSGIWLGRHRSQLVPDLADDIWITGKHFTISSGGLGFGFYRNYLDYGASPITQSDSEVVGVFDSHEHVTSYGLGVDLMHYAPHFNAVHVAIGMNYRKFLVNLSPISIVPDPASFDSGEATNWDLDLGTLATWRTPLPGISYQHAPLFNRFGRAERERLSSFGLRGGVVIKNLLSHQLRFIDQEQSDPLGRFLHTGVAGELIVRDLPPFPHIIRVLMAWDQQDLKQPAYDWVENYRGFEINILGILSMRRGYIDDPNGDITDSTTGWGIGFDLFFEDAILSRLGFAYDYADIPQASDLDRVDKRSYSLWCDVNWAYLGYR